MINCPFLPFCEYELIRNEQVNCLTIEVVVFTKAWGPYKVGDKADSLSFDFIGGTVIEYKLSDIYAKVQQFNIQCITALDLKQLRLAASYANYD